MRSSSGAGCSWTGCGYYAIAKLLTNQGVPSPSRYDPPATAAATGGPGTSHAVRAILILMPPFLPFSLLLPYSWAPVARDHRGCTIGWPAPW
jgi:hypothetical protein